MQQHSYLTQFLRVWNQSESGGVSASGSVSEDLSGPENSHLVLTEQLVAQKLLDLSAQALH